MADIENTSPQNTPQHDWKGGFFTYLRLAFSHEGEPSSSRFLTGILVATVVGIVIGIFHHICRLTDAPILSLWLGAIPIIIGCLVAFMTCLYFVNRGSSSVTDVMSIFTKKQ